MSLTSTKSGFRGRPRADAVADLDERLLASATSTFIEQGYGATSVAQIIRAARVSSKTVYARYTGKEDLFFAVIERLLAPARTRLVHLVARGDGDIEEILLAIATANFRHWVSSTEIGLYRLLISEGVQFPELSKIYRRSIEPSNTILMETLANAKASGCLHIDDLETAGRMFNYMTCAYIRDEKLLNKHIDENEAVRIVSDGVRLFIRLYCGGTLTVASMP